MALIRRRRSFQFFYFLLFKDSREEAKEYDENAIRVYKLKGVPEDGIDILLEEIKEKSSVEILEGEQVSETRPGSEKSNGDGNDGSEEKDNPKEDQTTKDIHEDKNDVGDEKKVLDGHIPIKLSKLINQFFQADDSNSMTATVVRKRKRGQGLLVSSTYKTFSLNKKRSRII